MFVVIIAMRDNDDLSTLGAVVGDIYWGTGKLTKRARENLLIFFARLPTILGKIFSFFLT